MYFLAMVAVSPGARLRRSEILQRKRSHSALPWRTANPGVKRKYRSAALPPLRFRWPLISLWPAHSSACCTKKSENRRRDAIEINLIRKANSISWLKNCSCICRPDMSRAQVKGPRDEICLKRPRLSKAKDPRTNALLLLMLIVATLVWCIAFLPSLLQSATGVCPDGGLLSPRLSKPRTDSAKQMYKQAVYGTCCFLSPHSVTSVFPGTSGPSRLLPAHSPGHKYASSLGYASFSFRAVGTRN